jgi:hypothetical protein
MTFDVVNRFTKTRRISRALTLPHPPKAAAGVSPPASIRPGAKTALVRCQCQVAQGPHPRVRFFARGGGGGVGVVLGSSSLVSSTSALLLAGSADFLVSHTNKHGFDKTPPLPRGFLSVESHATSMRHTMPPCPA